MQPMREHKGSFKQKHMQVQDCADKSTIDHKYGWTAYFWDTWLLTDKMQDIYLTDQMFNLWIYNIPKYESKRKM